MCVGFWSLEHPNYALVICTNRDEYLSRPTSHAHFHSFGELPENESKDEERDLFVLSGRDLQAGGSWFGINRAGRVALLTNIAEETTRQYGSSRGRLVSSFLSSPESLAVEDYVRDLTSGQPSSTDYAGFNLALFAPSATAVGGGGENSNSGPGSRSSSLSYSASIVTNSGGGGVISSRPLSSGERCVGGVSNGVEARGGQTWPKVVKGRDALTELLQSPESLEDEDKLIENLFALLAWTPAETPSNRLQLRTSIHIPPLAMTGSLHPEARPIPDAQPHHHYGTRLSTILLVGRDGRVRFVERDIWVLLPANIANANAGLGTTSANGNDDNSNKGTTSTTGNSSANDAYGDEDEADDRVVRGDPRQQREYSFYLDSKSSESDSQAEAVDLARD